MGVGTKREPAYTWESGSLKWEGSPHTQEESPYKCERSPHKQKEVTYTNVSYNVHQCKLYFSIKIYVAQFEHIRLK